MPTFKNIFRTLKSFTAQERPIKVKYFATSIWKEIFQINFYYTLLLLRVFV